MTYKVRDYGVADPGGRVVLYGAKGRVAGYPTAKAAGKAFHGRYGWSGPGDDSPHGDYTPDRGDDRAAAGRRHTVPVLATNERLTVLRLAVLIHICPQLKQVQIPAERPAPPAVSPLLTMSRGLEDQLPHARAPRRTGTRVRNNVPARLRAN